MPGRPSLAGRSLLPVLRPTSGMGGGGSALKVCADHRGGINWLSLSPDGQRLLTGSEDGTARLWSTADGQCCALLQGHESYVTFCQLEDEAAFTCSADCTIRKWDVLTGQCLQVFRGHTSIVNRILVANNQLFSSSYDRTARAWNVDKGQVSWEFRGHRNCVLTLAYLASWDLPGAPCMEEAMAGGLLVTGSTDGMAKVWQVASGCCHQTLRGHTGAVLCLVLDTPSHTAFTGSTDATIRAWDILSGEQLRVFREHQGSVICLEDVAAIEHLMDVQPASARACLLDTGPPSIWMLGSGCSWPRAWPALPFSRGWREQRKLTEQYNLLCPASEPQPRGMRYPLQHPPASLRSCTHTEPSESRGKAQETGQALGGLCLLPSLWDVYPGSSSPTPEGSRSLVGVEPGGHRPPVEKMGQIRGKGSLLSNKLKVKLTTEGGCSLPCFSSEELPGSGLNRWSW
nr:WD repeat-containing protein 86 isoform X4 [Camelus dromedarius]